MDISTGCVISLTLLSRATNMLTKSAELECRGPRTNSTLSMLLRQGINQDLCCWERRTVEDKFLFHIAGMAMPTITKWVKNLGKLFNCFPRDMKSILSTGIKLDGWLKVVDKSGLTWKFKTQVWHGILPRIMWPPLIHAIPISLVESLGSPWRGESATTSGIARLPNSPKQHSTTQTHQ